jgi:hypothetical protein
MVLQAAESRVRSRPRRCSRRRREQPTPADASAELPIGSSGCFLSTARCAAVSDAARAHPRPFEFCVFLYPPRTRRRDLVPASWTLVGHVHRAAPTAAPAAVRPCATFLACRDASARPLQRTVPLGGAWGRLGSKAGNIRTGTVGRICVAAARFATTGSGMAFARGCSALVPVPHAKRARTLRRPG